MGTEHTSLWCTCVRDQRGGSMAPNSHHLGPVHQKVENPSALERIRCQEGRSSFHQTLRALYDY